MPGGRRCWPACEPRRRRCPRSWCRCCASPTRGIASTIRAGARVTIDSDIQATGVNVAMVPGHAPVALDNVVFEYKGRAFDLPAHLAPIVRFGARRTAFSKYLACYQAVTRLTL